MLNLQERFRRFSASDIILSYTSKLMFGIGFGAILSAYLRQIGWILIIISVLLAIPVEIKFWKPNG